MGGDRRFLYPKYAVPPSGGFWPATASNARGNLIKIVGGVGILLGSFYLSYKFPFENSVDCLQELKLNEFQSNRRTELLRDPTDRGLRNILAKEEAAILAARNAKN